MALIPQVRVLSHAKFSSADLYTIPHAVLSDS